MITILIYRSLTDSLSSFSGPSITLVVSKAGESLDTSEGTIEQFRDLIGPKDVNIAKEEAPNR